MKELKPCPFCGGEAEMQHAMGEWWALCPICKANVDGKNTEQRAVEAWNSRAATTIGKEQTRWQ